MAAEAAAVARGDHAAPALPLTLAGFKDRHAGETFVVCGCGPSLQGLTQPERFITIGVNDVGRAFTPDYLLVLNTRPQFAAGRFQAVAESRAKALFTHLELGISHPHIVRFALGKRGGVDFSNPATLNYTRNSPYPAVCLAVLMGAKRIGLIGVDFTNGHFFGGKDVHPLARELTQIDGEYRRLHEACAAIGVELVNLSAESRLTGLPKQSLDEFAAASAPARPLRIVSYATTPVAGVPAILARAIAHAGPHQGRCVWAQNAYGNGVSFQGDVEYSRQPQQANELLEAADLVVVHNGKIEPRHESLLAGKPVLTLAHNYIWNVDQRFVQRGFPGLVVAQYQAVLPEFAGWTPVANPMPLWEPDFSPDATAKCAGGPVSICFAPSGKHERYPAGHRLFWHAKGYATTMAALDALQKTHGVKLEVIRGGQVTHREAMAMKQRSHIVIDECATGSYHRASLEGLAVGAVVVNGVGQLAGVPELIRQCAGAEVELPFVTSNLEHLHRTLQGLIEQGPAALMEAGRRNRLWMEQNWGFEQQWARQWQPAVERALDVASGGRPRPLLVAAPAPAQPATPPAVPAAPTLVPADISAVVPFAGAERLPALAACLASLRAQGVGEILLAECDTAPHAQQAAKDSGARYVFIPRAAGFHKARAMNVGASFATGAVLLWCDADLLLPPGFLTNALEELESRRLDYLIPWTSVAYLDQASTATVLAGKEEGFAAPACKTLYSRHGYRGGAGLLRTGFFRLHGGVCEDFIGWGGEDESFFHKAALLGRAAATNQAQQHLRHLYHPASGGLEPELATGGNPNHAANATLSRDIRRIGAGGRFLERFPPPKHPPAPWEGVRRIGTTAGSEPMARALAEYFGPAIKLCPAGEPADVQAPAGAPPGLTAMLEFAATLTLPGNVMDPMALPPKLRLNLGCGDASIAGFVNVDRFGSKNVDQIADLSQPWPWADDAVDEIRAWDVIEHLPDKILTMNEMWRVLRPGGRAEIMVPTTDGPGAFQDPTHVSFWHRRSFLYYEACCPYRERFAESYGIRAAFRVVRESIAQSIDGPKLTILLEAVKTPAKADETAPYDVVILSANPDNLIACVEAVRRCQPALPASHIIVVDDGAKAKAQAALPGIRWVEGAKPFVFARNANLGLAASGRDVILLNDDALLTTQGGFDALAQAARHSAAGAVSSAISGQVGNQNQKPQPGAALRPEPRQLCFVCVYLPHETVELVGSLDERFTGYGYDDDDYCDRIRAAGRSLAVFDGCVVQHGGVLPSSFRSKADFGSLSALNRTLYHQKQRGLPAQAAEVLGVLRIKNEAAHIGEVLESLLPLCPRILVFDDHSEDDTAAICQRFGSRIELTHSPFTGFDEARDKNHMLAHLGKQNPDWVLWIDGDEVLERDGAAQLRPLLQDPQVAAYSLRIAYLWDAPDQLRVDGLFGRFTRQSLFRLRGQKLNALHFPKMGPGNLHCGNVPRGLRGEIHAAGVRLKHYGYMQAEQRQRKYEWYNKIDPGNHGEDEYRHIIGMPGARHAPGPVQLVPWDG
jgi:glycosyltransferase involved in cell wall biosynthesis/GT2 family glycosyltransferase/SAM-dependent methyltransferase